MHTVKELINNDSHRNYEPKPAVLHVGVFELIVLVSSEQLHSFGSLSQLWLYHVCRQADDPQYYTFDT